MTVWGRAPTELLGTRRSYKGLGGRGDLGEERSGVGRVDVEVIVTSVL